MISSIVEVENVLRYDADQAKPECDAAQREWLKSDLGVGPSLIRPYGRALALELRQWIAKRLPQERTGGKEHTS